MNISNIKSSLTRGFGRGSLYLQKHSPEILLGAGLVGMVATIVMASRATLKVNDLIRETKEESDLINEAGFIGKTRDGRPYSQEDYKKDIGIHYVQTGLKFAKLYGPSIGLGVLSIGTILGAHGIMAKRQVALIAAYNLLGEGFKNYRNRVVEEFGAEKDELFRLGLKEETRTETVIDEEGKKTKVKKTNKAIYDPQMKSIYSRFFDESNPNYRTDRTMNKAFLQAQQNYMNDVLIIRGHVFLNEVYEALGFPHTKEGAIVGWVLKSSAQEMKEEHRDGYIDFGIYDVENDPGREFVNGTNPTILLDFNVDGIIFYLI